MSRRELIDIWEHFDNPFGWPQFQCLALVYLGESVWTANDASPVKP